MNEATCLHCANPFTPLRRDSRFCGRPCAARYLCAHPKSSCSVAECDRGAIARGMCSTHYNRLVAGEAKRHPRQTVACVVCSTLVRRRKDSDGRYQPTCSVECRTIVQWGRRLAPRSSSTWRADAATRARRAGCQVIESFNRDAIFDRDGWQCRDCGIQCNQPDPFDRTAATIDHVVPLSLGGNHTKANTQTLCLSCNSRKQDHLAVAA